ncbi:hypothetical protein ACTFIR_001451 [Dictyostelium discoideum]
MQQNFYNNNNTNNNYYNNFNNNYNIRNNHYINTNDHSNKPPLPELKKKYIPTFLNKLIGLPPSHDPISLLKFKLKVIKILVICFGFVVMASTLSIINFESRSTSFKLEHQNQTYVPSVYLFFEVTNYKDIFKFDFLRENIATGAYDEIVVQGLNLNDTEGFTKSGIFQNCVDTPFFKDGFVILDILDGCLYLYENEQLLINIYKYSTNDTDPWFISMYIDDQPFYLDSTVQMSTSLTKSIVTSQNGDTTEKYKLSRAISYPQKNVTDGGDVACDIYTYGIFFSSHFVLQEKTQTNFLVVVSILSNIGSYISYLFIGSEVIFTMITKFLIRDKSAWVDDDIRECIIYHSNQINTDNLLNENKNDDDDNINGNNNNNNDDNTDGNDSDGNGNNEESVEQNQGINDDQIELEGDNEDEDEDEDNPINPLIMKDQLEEEEERDEDRNNYFILKDRSIK